MRRWCSNTPDPKLALVEWASGMRLTVLLALLANLFVPWGIASSQPGLIEVVIGVAAITVKVAILAVALAGAEVLHRQAATVPGARTARGLVPAGAAGRRVGELLHGARLMQ